MAARRMSPLASATRALGVRPRHLQRHRLALNDGAVTTLHVAAYDLRRTVPRVVRLPAPTPVERWCREHGVGEAMVGGFFVRPGGTPLGELRTSGIARPARPFDAPWGDVRGCLHVVGGHVALARRDELPAEPPGDLLQAGPLLVRRRRALRRRGRRGLLGGPGAVRFRHHRRALSARGAGSGAARATAGRRLRWARRRRGGAHAGRAGRGARRPRCARGAQPRRRWLDLARVRRPAAQRPARGSRRRAGGRATGLDRGRVHGSVTTLGYNRRVHVLSALMFFPRGGSAHVARALARELPAHGCEVTIVLRITHGPWRR